MENTKKANAVDKYIFETLKNIAIKKRKNNHKCQNCSWGRWTGTKYKCALPRCMPKLGNFNGVDKNDS